MRTLFIVFRKEFLDNLRDRRTLMSAILFGPLFGPLLFGLMISRMLEQSVVEADEPLKITISGSAYAPGLTRFMESQGAHLTKKEFTEVDARTAVRSGHDTPGRPGGPPLHYIVSSEAHHRGIFEREIKEIVLLENVIEKIASVKNANPSSENGMPIIGPAHFINCGHKSPSSKESTVPDTAPTPNMMAVPNAHRRASVS